MFIVLRAFSRKIKVISFSFLLILLNLSIAINLRPDTPHTASLMSSPPPLAPPSPYPSTRHLTRLTPSHTQLHLLTGSTHPYLHTLPQSQPSFIPLHLSFSYLFIPPLHCVPSTPLYESINLLLFHPSPFCFTLSHHHTSCTLFPFL